MKGFRRGRAALLTVCLCFLLSACQGNPREKGVEAGGSRSLAAEALGVSRATLWRRMKKYGLDQH